MALALPILTLAFCILTLAAVAMVLLRLQRGPDPAPFNNILMRLESIYHEMERMERRLKEDIEQGRDHTQSQAKDLRDEIGSRLTQFGDLTNGVMKSAAEAQKGQLDSFTQQFGTLTRTIEERIKALQADNAQKLEQMRHTVDEKLQGTLEKRLGESFRLVSDRLDQVHKGLGEMQILASGVGDLKKVLTNVKTRGTWGEMQLGNLLEQILAPEQFLREAECKPGSGERVDFAIRLPGRDENDQEVLLPIDAKFPREDYERLIEASEHGDLDGVDQASRMLELRMKGNARVIKEKYLNPPRTTDFAIMFLPTESLYAELLRRPGLVEHLQREFRVSLAGPTTLGALLNSLQMGFRTLAIQKRSGEVWEILGAVKTEFEKYGAVLDKVQKKLQEASKTIDDVAIRRRAIDRRLRQVQALPHTEAQTLLGVDEGLELENEEAGI